MQRVAQVPPCQRADLGILVQRIAHFDGAHALQKALFKCAPHLVDHDEALRRDAALAGIHQPPWC
jgi:hypothetical protein